MMIAVGRLVISRVRINLIVCTRADAWRRSED